MVEPVDDDDCSDPVSVEAFTSLLYQDAELLSALMQRVIAKTKSSQTAVAQLRADVGQEIVGLNRPLAPVNSVSTVKVPGNLDVLNW